MGLSAVVPASSGLACSKCPANGQAPVQSSCAVWPAKVALASNCLGRSWQDSNAIKQSCVYNNMCTHRYMQGNRRRASNMRRASNWQAQAHVPAQSRVGFRTTGAWERRAGSHYRAALICCIYVHVHHACIADVHECLSQEQLMRSCSSSSELLAPPRAVAHIMHSATAWKQQAAQRSGQNGANAELLR
jgi:hypothetical protein